MKFSFHHTVRIRPWPKNKPAGCSGSQDPGAPPWPVSFPPQTIYAYVVRCLENLSRPIVYRQGRRYRTYSTEVTSSSEQSPASSHTRFGQNLPARLIRITKFPLGVKREFCIFYRFFCVIFVQNADCGGWRGKAQDVGLMPSTVRGAMARQPPLGSTEKCM